MTFLDQESWVRVDHHIHTPYCHHARSPMVDSVQKAIAAGMRRICFLEHVEAGFRQPRVTWLSPEELDAYWQEGQQLKARFQDQIEIRVGIEIGWNPEAVSELRALRFRHPWEWVGLSRHFIQRPDLPMDLNLMSMNAPENARMVLQLTFVEIITMVYQQLSTALFEMNPNMLCHLDAVRRAIPDGHAHPDAVASRQMLLRAIQASGVALEINTSGIDQDDRPYPDWSIITEAIQMELPLVLSSDSHDSDQIGRYFRRTARRLGRVAHRLGRPLRRMGAPGWSLSSLPTPPTSSLLQKVT